MIQHYIQQVVRTTRLSFQNELLSIREALYILKLILGQRACLIAEYMRYLSQLFHEIWVPHSSSLLIFEILHHLRIMLFPWIKWHIPILLESELIHSFCINELFIPLDHKFLYYFQDFYDHIQRYGYHVGVRHPVDQHRDEERRLAILIAFNVVKVAITKSPALRERREQNDKHELKNEDRKQHPVHQTDHVRYLMRRLFWILHYFGIMPHIHHQA